MTFIDKSGQHVGNGSTAVQISGNATFGNTTSEVLTLCDLAIRAQMSSLREDAFEVIDQRAKEFGHQIASKLSSELNDQLIQKLADPDIQYSINQAVIQVARKGINEKSELLKELIISKINNETEDECIIIDKSLEITEILTTNEIKLLALIYFFRSISKLSGNVNITAIADNNVKEPFPDGITLAQIHDTNKKIYSNYLPDYIMILGELSSIGEIQMDYLDIKGVTFVGKNYVTDLPKLLSKRIGVPPPSDDEEFFKNFPILKNIFSSFRMKSVNEFDSIVLNPIGNLIALNYLKAKGYLQ